MRIPTFLELAKTKLAYAGPRDKTIVIKVAISTARMMVESETALHSELLSYAGCGPKQEVSQ